MKKDWKAPSLEILDVSLTMKGFGGGGHHGGGKPGQGGGGGKPGHGGGNQPGDLDS